jgi:DNA-directed RNA polymerase III subunit RPC1
VEGSTFAQVLAAPGVDATNARTNDVIALAAVLGIEAARASLEHELKFVMEQHHVDLNKRHFGLLSDFMTWTGSVLGVTRHGMAKSKPGILVMASFERTAESLFDAAVHNRRDDVRGVSEAVLTGQPIPVGTGGSFDLLDSGQQMQNAPKRVPWLHTRTFRK